MVVFGQDDAIDVLASSIRLARSGLGDQKKPVGSFFASRPMLAKQKLPVNWPSSWALN